MCFSSPLPWGHIAPTGQPTHSARPTYHCCVVLWTVFAGHNKEPPSLNRPLLEACRTPSFTEEAAEKMAAQETSNALPGKRDFITRLCKGSLGSPPYMQAANFHNRKGRSEDRTDINRKALSTERQLHAGLEFVSKARSTQDDPRLSGNRTSSWKLCLHIP